MFGRKKRRQQEEMKSEKPKTYKPYEFRHGRLRARAEDLHANYIRELLDVATEATDAIFHEAVKSMEYNAGTVSLSSHLVSARVREIAREKVASPRILYRATSSESIEEIVKSTLTHFKFDGFYVYKVVKRRMGEPTRVSWKATIYESEVLKDESEHEVVRLTSGRGYRFSDDRTTY